MAKVGSAKRHAQAVFEIARDNNEVDKWRAEMDIIGDTLSDPQLAAVLEDPKIRLDDKIQIIDKVLPDVGQLARNLVYLLVSKQRMSIVAQIVSEYRRMADSHKGLEHATVTTAIELDVPDKEKVASHLATITGKQIVLDSAVDPEIIGGFVARISDKLIDGSTKAQLESLKKELTTAI